MSSHQKDKVVRIGTHVSLAFLIVHMCVCVGGGPSSARYDSKPMCVPYTVQNNHNSLIHWVCTILLNATSYMLVAVA